jgi:hypothetical protein
MLLPLSQTEVSAGAIAFWIAILIAATVVLALGVYGIKRWMRNGDSRAGSVWTLQELTELRDAGELTIQQYEQLKANLIEEIKGTETDRDFGNRSGRS